MPDERHVADPLPADYFGPYGAPPEHPPGPAPMGEPLARPAVPSRATTVVITVLFGLFGLIPATIHGRRAERLGVSSSRYWVAFGVSFAVSAAVYVGLIVAVFAILVNSGVSAAEAPAQTGWADAPEPGSCYYGVREEVEAFGGVIAGSSGPGYYPRDCNEQAAFFVVSGLVDGITRADGDPPVCEQFGPVYTAVWYDVDGEAEHGPQDGLGTLVCLRER